MENVSAPVMHHMKARKIIRNNRILECLREPLTSKQLSAAMGRPNVNMHDACMSMTPKFIKITGFVVGSTGRKSYLFQSVRFDYVELEPGEFVEVNSKGISDGPNVRTIYGAENIRWTIAPRKSQPNRPSGSTLSVAV